MNNKGFTVVELIAAFSITMVISIFLFELLLEVKAETQTILQLLVAKGIVTREEVAETRNRVKNSPNYKPLYEYLENAADTAKFYKDNPEQHLRDIFKAKLDGKMV